MANKKNTKKKSTAKPKAKAARKAAPAKKTIAKKAAPKQPIVVAAESVTKPSVKVRLLRALKKKRYFIPIYIVVGLIIALLLASPFLPQAQSKVQQVTKDHPALAKVVPKSFQPADVSLPTSGNWLVIPKSDIKMPINEGADISVLNNEIGVWHQTGRASDNYVLAGHKLQYGRTVNQSLYNLNKLVVGDRGVYLILDGKATEYSVFTAEVVPPTAIEILNPTGKPQLTIYTCNDFFNQRRFVIMASPI